MGTTIRAMLNTDRKTVSGNYPLVIRIIHNRHKKLIYSPYKLRLSDFDADEERVNWSDSLPYSVKQVKQINQYIQSQKRSIIMRAEQLTKKWGSYSLDDLLSETTNIRACRTLFEYMDRQIERKLNMQRFGTAILYRTTKQSLKRFTGDRNLLISDVDYHFISAYVDHLRVRQVKENTIHMYLRNLRAIYNQARKEQLFIQRSSPFEDVKMNGTKTVKRAISKEMMRRIAQADFSDNSELDLARDLFLFSFYTRGMSLIDVLYLRRTNIASGRIFYARNKTNQYIEVSVTPPLQRLIDKYHSDSSFVMPYLLDSNTESLYRQYRSAFAVINRHLKRIGLILEIGIPLTSYVARHSWATIAKSEGVPIAAISEGLGHTTEKTTQIYLKAFDCSVIDNINEQIVSMIDC